MTTTKERSAGKSAGSGWPSDLDRQAVDHIRALAMDAVQAAGDGHPGTAMSLAPAAYLLFQEFLRHDPTDPELDRARPLRAVLRALQPHPLHPALPVRLRPHPRRPEALPAVGQPDPGPPRARPHARRRDHHRSARLRASPARSGWRWPPAASAACYDPDAKPGESVFDHTHLGVRLRRRHGGGRLGRGVAASPATSGSATSSCSTTTTTSPSRATPTSRSARTSPPVTPPTAGTSRTSPTPRTSTRCARRSRRPRPRPTGRASSGCAASSATRRRTCRTPARRTAARSAPKRWRPPKRSWASTRSSNFAMPDDVLAHAREVVDRGRARARGLGRPLPGLAQGATRPAPSCSTG